MWFALPILCQVSTLRGACRVELEKFKITSRFDTFLQVFLGSLALYILRITGSRNYN